MTARVIANAQSPFRLDLHLDAQTLPLFALRELVTTPAYVAATISYGAYTGDNAKLVFDSSFNLGIFGTPAAKLHLVGGSFQLDNSFQIQWGGANNAIFGSGSTNTVDMWANNVFGVRLDSSVFRPGIDNARTLGAASFRWSTVYAATGSINTSDAREKTAVAPMTANEVAAAKQLAGELGTFSFLEAVASKSAAARVHVGMTVQRAIEIMTTHGLDPLRYGFICYDSWAAQSIPARMKPRKTGLFNANGEELVEQEIVSPTRAVPAGDRYSFRPDELLLFIARGQAAHQEALEARIVALEALCAP